MIKVSVVIPCYNAERYLCECLDSVAGQTLREIEIICIDDGSTDGTLSILGEYQKKDSRIVVLKQKNLYAGVARNRGIDESKGKYLIFWDADDFFEPDALEQMYDQCQADNADICVCSFRVYDDLAGCLVSSNHGLSLKYLPEAVPFSCQDYPDAAFRFSSSAPWNKMLRREFVLKEGLQFQAIQRANDLYFVCMSVALAGRITVVDKILVNYRRFTATSLQETSTDMPFDFYIALKALRQGLSERNLFQLLERSFINLALANAVYTLSVLKSKETWIRVVKRLRGEIFRELGVLGHTKSFFFLPSHYDKMNFLLNITEEELVLHEPELRKDGKTAKKPSPATQAGPDGFLKISVIIPVYNTEDYLEECLRSVMRQTLRDIEIICIDDGSTDCSPGILEMLNREDGRIQVLRQENQGLSLARNAGIREAKGEYIVFLDSDDLLVWCALEHLYNRAKADELDELFFGGESFYKPVELYKEYPVYRTYYHYKNSYESVETGQSLFVRLRENDDFKPSACLHMLRRAFLEESRLAYYPGIIHEDNLFVLQSLMNSQRAGVLPEPLYLRRVRPESTMTTRRSWKNTYGYLVCIRETGKSMATLNIGNMDFAESIAKYQVQMGCSAEKALKNLTTEEIRAELSKLPAHERSEIALLLESFRQNRVLKECGEAQKKKLSYLQKKVKRLNKRNNELLRSLSYRIGRLISAPLCFLRRLLSIQKN
ncbi:MAG: glycosyltransferase [Oscillospiraceae bacterium]|nr:glycosyltransferase [Oscillospiraceae bacterium]